MSKTTILAAALLLGTSAAALAADPIRIGVVTPLSGTYAPIGQRIRWGLELAAQEVNQKGGLLGRPVELLFEDEEANPSVAVQKAEKLFQVANVDFLTGTVNSGSTLAVGHVAEHNDRLVATTVSYADSITGDKCLPNVFRVNARAGQQSAALAEWLNKEKPKSKVLFLDPDYEMGRSTVAAFKQAATSKDAAEDYSQYFGQLRASRPNVPYTSMAGNDTARLLTQLDEHGLLRNVTVVGASGAVASQNLGAIGKAADGFVTGVGYSPEIDTAENKAFVDAFHSAFKNDPDLFAADSYGLIYFYKAAVEKAGSTDTAKLRDAMRGIQWKTPQGTKTMRAGDHQTIQDMYVVQVKGGKFQIVDTVLGDAAIGPDTCTKF